MSEGLLALSISCGQAVGAQKLAALVGLKLAFHFAFPGDFSCVRGN